MGHIATTTDQQISILESRGMSIDMPIDKVKEILLDIGYYRLGFYWNPFEIDSLHNFRKDTKFSEVLDLYYLDNDLRRLLSKYLQRIEINLRTSLVYYISNKYIPNTIWFIDSSIVLNEFRSNFDQIVYNYKFIEKNNAIKNHHLKYPNDRYAPAWKTIEFLTFGSLIKLIKSLIKMEDKNIIASVYRITSLNMFVKLLDVLLFTRNASAHGTALFDINLPLSLPRILSMNINSNNNNNLDTMIKVIIYFLSQISVNRKREFEAELSEILSKFKTQDTINQIITTKMGIRL